MLGYAFMGKAHSNAFINDTLHDVSAARDSQDGRHRRAQCRRRVEAAADALAMTTYYTDWREMLANDEIQLFDNGGPNDAHAEPSIAAAQAGKHVLCEKPLGRTAEESKTMWMRCRRRASSTWWPSTIALCRPSARSAS